MPPPHSFVLSPLVGRYSRCSPSLNLPSSIVGHMEHRGSTQAASSIMNLSSQERYAAPTTQRRQYRRRVSFTSAPLRWASSSGVFVRAPSRAGWKPPQHHEFSSGPVECSGEKKVLVPISEGTEEIEAVTIIDVLRRAGAVVTVAKVWPASGSSSDDLVVRASRGVKLVADKSLEECSRDMFDLIAIPGGLPGAEHLRDSVLLLGMLQQQSSEDRYVAAVCASPAVVLATHGLLQGRTATGYPADRFNTSITAAGGFVADSRVVVDGKVVTSQGPGTSMVFAVKLIELLYGREKANEVAAGLLISPV